ncbi:MAG: carotenoid biosynthesis protein [Desulfobulbaceae bacterium]|nr:carotenoid biosynthesis protein [Candidatus Kapabacteria bacterium]MBS3999975.1 carotenoid biosynthesis protein [Desulfobulbaceae bacterium]
MERKKNSAFIRFIDNEVFKIIVVYFLLISGAIWQVLDMFTEITRPAAGPIIILLSILAFWEILRKYKLPKPNKDGIIDQPNLRNNFIVYFIVVIVVSWVIELIGVRTHSIFGTYNYNDVLRPTLYTVPVAIGFAWFLALVTSHAILQKTSRINLNGIPNLIKSVIIGFTMMFFDFLMEPAAIRLYYWTWKNDIVPLQNYFVWFLLGASLAYLGFKMRVLKIVFPNIIFHIFLAMVAYFLIIQFG